MNVMSSGIVNGVIQPQYGGHGTQFNVNGIPTYALRGTIFIQAAHRICKPGQAGGGNGIGGKHIPVTETALRRKRKGLTGPFPIQKTAWKAGKSEVICLHGGLRFHHIGRMVKNFRADLDLKKKKSLRFT